MYRFRRYSSTFRPREYADRLADAAGAGGDASTARRYAGGTGPLRRHLHPHREPAPSQKSGQPDKSDPSDPFSAPLPPNVSEITTHSQP